MLSRKSATTPAEFPPSSRRVPAEFPPPLREFPPSSRPVPATLREFPPSSLPVPSQFPPSSRPVPAEFPPSSLQFPPVPSLSLPDPGPFMRIPIISLHIACKSPATCSSTAVASSHYPSVPFPRFSSIARAQDHNMPISYSKIQKYSFRRSISTFQPQASYGKSTLLAGCKRMCE